MMLRYNMEPFAVFLYLRYSQLFWQHIVYIKPFIEREYIHIFINLHFKTLLEDVKMFPLLGGKPFDGYFAHT